jgi:hypothetical protein
MARPKFCQDLKSELTAAYQRKLHFLFAQEFDYFKASDEVYITKNLAFVLTCVDALGSGLPDFSWYKIPKWGEMYQMATKFTKWP